MSAGTVRNELECDTSAISAVHRAAFPTDAEARLVERLREHGKTIISLVADVQREVVGHILISPLTIAERPELTGGLGLAPVAVLPESQRRGVGGQLIRAGLARCGEKGYQFVAVLGHREY